MPDLVELLKRRGHIFKPPTSKGVATSCPYPNCDADDDGFVIFTAGFKERFWCRKCDRNGDAIQLLEDLDGLSFDEAKAATGVHTSLQKKEPEREEPPPVEEKPVNGAKIVKTYDYTDADGKLLYQVQRWEPKSFTQRRPSKTDPKKWVEGRGVMKDIQVVLYGLENIPLTDWILFLEGEKDVERAWALDLPATCNLGGSGKLPKQQEEWKILEPLRGKKVFVIPDLDKPGLKHADQVCKLLYDIADEIRLVKLPGEKRESDFSDWVDEVNDDKAAPEILKGHIQGIEPWHPPRVSRSLLEIMEMEFPNEPDAIGNGILPSREILLISGPTAIGKSFLRMQISICLADGQDLFDMPIARPRKVFVFQYENPLKTENQRIRAMFKSQKFNREAIKNIEQIERKIRFDVSNKEDRPRLLEIARKSEADVFIFDCLSNVHSQDENANGPMRQRVMDFFAELNEECRSSIIIIHHFGKKSAEVPEDKMTARGAQSIQDAAATSFTYRRRWDKTKNRFLWTLKCDIIRSGPILPPITLESDSHFWLTTTEVETTCPPSRVAEILREKFSGECETQTELKEAIMAETECVDRTAGTCIRVAVEAMKIAEVVVVGGKGHSKGYRVV